MVGRTFVITENLGSILKEGMIVYVYDETEEHLHVQVMSHHEQEDFFNHFKLAKSLARYLHKLN